LTRAAEAVAAEVAAGAPRARKSAPTQNPEPPPGPAHVVGVPPAAAGVV
jgi:hypothetical protein